MTKDLEMGQLVDHDGFQRPGRRQDEPPREHQPALPRGASPAAAWVSDVDAAWCDAEGRGVLGDRLLDGLGGTLAEPGGEDPVEGASLGLPEADDELVAILAAAALDGRAAADGPIAADPHPVRLASVEHQAAVACPAAGACRRTLPSLSIHVPQDPRLALDQERLDSCLRMRPAAARLGRDRHHQPVSVVDRDAQTARTSGAAEAILDRSLAEPDASTRRIGREDRRMLHRATS